jgi:hypothetical protein
VNAWRDFQGFSIGLGRWLLGGAPPAGVQATIERRGGQGIVRIELDPGRVHGEGDVRGATATILPPGTRSGEAPQRLPLSWVGEDVLEARFPLRRSGVYLGAVRLATGDVLPLPPLSLPYSPEFEPRSDPAEGRTTLAEMARLTGGIERTTWDDVFGGTGSRDRQMRDLVIPLTAFLLAMHLLEIGGRRLLLFAAASEWMRTTRLPTPRIPWVRRPTTVPDERRADSDQSLPPAPVPPKPVTSPLARAKAKARSRLER